MLLLRLIQLRTSRRHTLVSVVFAGIAGGAPAAGLAQDASFGCKVLLCAAASNPSWSGIPYCVPVMTQLFRMLRRGGGWPTCPEGNAGGLGYEPYQPCPTGQIAYGQVQSGDNGSTSLQPDPNGAFCVDPERYARMCSGQDNQAGCDPTYQPTPRAPRAEPHFVDITSGGATSRFYFSLRGY